MIKGLILLQFLLASAGRTDAEHLFLLDTISAYLNPWLHQTSENTKRGEGPCIQTQEFRIHYSGS